MTKKTWRVKLGASCNAKVPVQSEFTVYEPVTLLNCTKLPFELSIAVTVVLPPPLKVCVPTSTAGPAIAGGATADPVDVYAYVPRRVLLLHPLSWAFALGAMARANAAMAVKVLAMVLRFMTISFLIRSPATSKELRR